MEWSYLSMRFMLRKIVVSRSLWYIVKRWWWFSKLCKNWSYCSFMRWLINVFTYCSCMNRCERVLNGMTNWVNTGKTALIVSLICVNTICNFKNIFETPYHAWANRVKPNLTSSKVTVWYFFYSGNIWCLNGSFEVANSVNTDETALTAMFCHFITTI